MAQRLQPAVSDQIVKQGLDPVLQFMRMMWAVDHKLQSVSKRMTNRIGLTGPQWFAVRCIGRRPGLAAGELAALLHLDPGTVTGILKRLEDAHMIAREQDASDGRRMRLTLTRAGRAVDRRSAGTVEKAIRRVLAHASSGDLAAAGRVFRRLASELDAVAVADPQTAAPKRRRVAARN
jgi:MarR family transcriptional regulator, organic hydroperoxide resistance regulator